MGKLIAALLTAIIGAAGAAAFSFFKEDLAVRVASIVVKGELDGEWLVDTFEYDNTPQAKLVRNCEPMRLKQLSFRVIGESGTSIKGWTISGYFNPPFLALSNVSASGTSGLGTFTGRAVPEGNMAFLGTQAAVNCKRTSIYPILLRCPAVLARESRRDLFSLYDKHLYSNNCEEIASDTASGRTCQTLPPPTRQPTKC